MKHWARTLTEDGISQLHFRGFFRPMFSITLLNREKGGATMGTPKRSKIARESIKSGGGDLRYKKPLDARAQKRSMDKASKKFREL